MGQAGAFRFADAEELFRHFQRAFGGGMGGFEQLFTGGRGRANGDGANGGGGWFMADMENGEQESQARLSLPLSFMEAVNGCSKQLTYMATVRCSTCKGTGARPGTQPILCPVCNGRGHVRCASGAAAARRRRGMRP